MKPEPEPDPALHPDGLHPDDTRASIAIDLGAESCRVSLLRWIGGRPEITLVHRFANSPREHDGLRWDLGLITAGVDEGMRRCAEIAVEGIRSVAVDGWAVDYVHLDAAGTPLADPFCYRDERTLAAEASLHAKIPAERMRELTGVQILRINTVYQLHADVLAARAVGPWLNLPEYILARWGGAPVAEYTNATHTQMTELGQKHWSAEIFAAAGIDLARAPRLVPPGTEVGRLQGPLAALPAFRDTVLIAPACHDTASAIAGIPAHGDDWAYISSGTWSLVGTLVDQPRNGDAARAENFTNLGAVGGQTCLHKNVNGMWLLRQCMEQWEAEGSTWNIQDLVAAAEKEPAPIGLLEVDDPDLLLAGHMPARINRQRLGHGLAPLDEHAANAPAFATLIFQSLAARYAEVLDRVAHLSGKRLERLFMVGGASQNEFLNRLTAAATGLAVHRGSPESSTLGNFAVQLAVLDNEHDPERGVYRELVSRWAAALADVLSRPAAQAAEPPSSSMTTNGRGMLMKARTGRIVTPEMVSEFSEDDPR